MRKLAKLIYCLMFLLTPAVGFAGIKLKDCVRTEFLEWREYLSGGAGGVQGTPGNALWGKGTDANCGIELWDLALIKSTAQTPDAGYVAKYVTQYDNGFLGTYVFGAYSNILWNVSGTVTALFDSSGMVHSTLDLYGTSADPLAIDKHIEAQIVTDFMPLIAGNDCPGWLGGCADYIGGAQTGNANSPRILSSYLQVVPEPGTLGLFGTAVALAGLGRYRRRPMRG